VTVSASEHAVCLDFRRVFGSVLLFLTVTAAQGGPNPAWRCAEHPFRLLIGAIPGDAPVLLAELPRGEGSDTEFCCAAFDQEGRPAPFRILHVDAQRASVLVHAGREPGRRVAVYYGGTAGTAAGDAEGPAPDPLPVAVDVHLSAGRSVPTSWAKMSYLYHHSGPPRRSFRLPRVEPAALFPEDPPAEQRWVVRMQTVLLCGEEGVYRLALDCRNAGFLVVDGERAVSSPGRRAGGRWRLGAPRLLEAGIHRLELFFFSESRLQARLGWVAPGRTEPAPIPDAALVTAHGPAHGRLESMSRTLQPDFRFEVGAPYAFRDCPAVFVPVRFRDTSVNWITNSVRARWAFGDGGTAEGAETAHTYAAPGRYRVRLAARDPLGFEAVCERWVDCRSVPVREYAVAAGIGQLAAVCYPDDIVEPVLRLAGRPPDGARFRVECDAAYRSGERRVLRRETGIRDDLPPLPLVRERASALSALSWRVDHEGVEIAGGRIRFLTPPFAGTAARVEADGLYDADGGRLVLVPHRSAGRFEQPRISVEQAFGHLVCVDDFLQFPGLPGMDRRTGAHRVLARIVDGPDRPVVDYVPVPDWQSAPQAYGPLLKLVRVPAAVRPETDVVVLSIGLHDILHNRDVRDFEREAAALSDLVSGTMRRPVIWVTPPPYPSDPGRVRPFAAAIRRVADARRMPVADVFTGFMGMEDAAPLLANDGDLCLTRAGEDLAAELIARALLAE